MGCEWHSSGHHSGTGIPLPDICLVHSRCMSPQRRPETDTSCMLHSSACWQCSWYSGRAACSEQPICEKKAIGTRICCWGHYSETAELLAEFLETPKLWSWPEDSQSKLASTAPAKKKKYICTCSCIPPKEELRYCDDFFYFQCLNSNTSVTMFILRKHNPPIYRIHLSNCTRL